MSDNTSSRDLIPVENFPEGDFRKVLSYPKFDFVSLFGNLCGYAEFYKQMSCLNKDFYERFRPHGAYGKLTRQLYRLVVIRDIPSKIVNLGGDSFVVNAVFYDPKCFVVSNIYDQKDQFVMYFNKYHMPVTKRKHSQRFKCAGICGICGKSIAYDENTEKKIDKENLDEIRFICLGNSTDNPNTIRWKNRCNHAVEMDELKHFICNLKNGREYQKHLATTTLLKRKREYYEYLSADSDSLNVFNRIMEFPQMAVIPATFATFDLDMPTSIFDSGKIFNDEEKFVTTLQSISPQPLFDYDIKTLVGIKLIAKLRAGAPFIGWNACLKQLENFREYFEKEFFDIIKDGK